ncbi:hypothetical protein LCGC14_1266860 [marine sediment metagenome]|uniref:Uncharacterized protein n=1 Tax=marine sediment metagenome TaxID=412755 RepID=A0A0F9KZ99_9ZZZZ
MILYVFYIFIIIHGESLYQNINSKSNFITFIHVIRNSQGLKIKKGKYYAK